MQGILQTWLDGKIDGLTNRGLHCTWFKQVHQKKNLDISYLELFILINNRSDQNEGMCSPICLKDSFSHGAEIFLSED